jgi:hypothetical protein
MSGNETPPRGASAVDDELEVGYDERFESRWRRTELVSHALMLVVVVMCASGLLGRGPISHRIESSTGGELNVDYEPISRHGTATQVTVHISTAAVAGQRSASQARTAREPQTVGLFVSSSFGEPMGLQDIIPRPVGSIAGNSGMTYIVQLDPTEEAALVRFVLKPNAIGPITLRARCNGAVVAWRQWVVP